MTRFRAVFFLALFTLASSFARADNADSPNLKVHQKKLSNGLTILVLERPLPVVALIMVMPVGAMDAPAGKTGLPHMLEHMLFKGTQDIGTSSYQKEEPLLAELDRVEATINSEAKNSSLSAETLASLQSKAKDIQDQLGKLTVKNELSKIYSSRGGRSLNAWTSQDATAYTVLLPANQIEAYAHLEENRFRHPVFREFYSERDVVAEERRLRNEADPNGALEEAYAAVAYKVHPYHNPAIGWMPEIKRLLRPDIQAFYDQHYRPDRGVLAVVGGVKAEAVFDLFEKTIGQVPNPAVKASVASAPEEPVQTEERRLNVPFEADPMAAVAWHQPSFPNDDAIALDVLCQVLAEGNSSRLVKNLVLKNKVAAWVTGEAGSRGRRAPGLFVLQFAPAEGKTLDDVLQAVDSELAELQEKGITQEELKRAKTVEKAGFIRQQAGTMDMATELALDQALYGNWELIGTYLRKVEALTPETLQQVARKYLTRQNRSVAFLTRPSHPVVAP